jgi:hypothetical protein
MVTKTILSVALTLFTFVNLFAGNITLTGVYQGKNLYVQNPFTSDMKEFCTQEVYVNNVKVNTNPTSSAFEIDLSHLKINDPVSIKIVHKDDCKPKILNAQVIRVKSSFQFVSFNATEDALEFVTKGEKANSKIIIEQFRNNNWLALSDLAAKGGADNNNYRLESYHNSGLNKYRLKYHDQTGEVFYSKVVEFNSTLPEAKFYPARVTKNLSFTRKLHFEILDAYGNIVKKGEGTEVDCSELAAGIYYVNFDNKSEKFLKK